MTWIVFLLALGAALRVTRLLVDDSISDGLRTNLEIHQEPALERRLQGVARFAHQALNCPWCTGVWASGLVFGTAYFFGDQKWWLFGAAALTASYLVGVFSLMTYALDERIEPWDVRESGGHDHDES